MSTERKISTTKRLAKSKAHRDAFVSAHIKEGLSFQLRALRKQRGWTQKNLGEIAGFNQSKISDYENPNYPSDLNLETVKRLASAFDVALIIRFVSFGDQISWVSDLVPGSLEVHSFAADPLCQSWLQVESVGSIGEEKLEEVIVSGLDTLESSTTLSTVDVRLHDVLTPNFQEVHP